MLFLNLEYQVLLIIVLTFSFAFFIGSLGIKYQNIKNKVFGMSFIIPLVLTVFSFITAPHKNTDAALLLITSHILLLLNCSFTILLNSKAPLLKLFYITPLIFIILGFGFSTLTLYTHLFWLYFIIILSALIINLILLINTMFHENKDQTFGHAGLFIIASAMIPWLMFDYIIVEAIILMALGYICCFIYLYKNSLGIFYKDYQSKSDSLRKMNVSINSEVIRRVEAIERSNKKLLENLKKDSMTNLLTKSAIIERLDAFIERSPKDILSIALFDIDNFKKINDTLGHQTGDLCIRNLANYIRTTFRHDDISGRFGGDEFIILLPCTTSIKAFTISNRFRETIQQKITPPITISVGIATYPQDGDTSEALVGAADKALYSSKQQGRNRITLFSSQL